MAVDAVRYRSRDRRAQAAAAKAKREKIILVVGGVVLLGLLAFEGPKTLKKFHGSSAPAPVTAPATTAGSAPAAASTPAHAAASVARLRRFSAKDPFVQQLGGSTGGAAVPTAAGPFVRTSHFVAKDPFVQQLALGAPAPADAASPPASGSAPRAQATDGGSGKYVVILASVPVTDGLSKAKAAAAAARRTGVTHVAIVDSSSYPTLRTGFYAVYSGPYPTLGMLLPALQSARGQGYPSAYTRQLAR